MLRSKLLYTQDGWTQDLLVGWDGMFMDRRSRAVVPLHGMLNKEILKFRLFEMKQKRH